MSVQADHMAVMENKPMRVEYDTSWGLFMWIKLALSRIAWRRLTVNARSSDPQF